MPTLSNWKLLLDGIQSCCEFLTSFGRVRRKCYIDDLYSETGNLALRSYHAPFQARLQRRLHLADRAACLSGRKVPPCRRVPHGQGNSGRGSCKYAGIEVPTLSNW